MEKNARKLFVLMLTLASVGCASTPPAPQPVAVTCPRPSAPPASLMQPPPNLLQRLDKIISVSETK